MQPVVLFDFLRKYEGSAVLYGLAVVVRALLGILLVVVAPATKFPLALAALGWLAIAAAVFIAAMGRARFAKLMSRVLSIPVALARVSGVVTMLLGGFLVYAVL